MYGKNLYYSEWGKKEPCSENDGTLTFDPPHIVVLMEKQMAVCTTPTKYLRIVVFVVSISSCSLQESSYSPHNVTLFITTHNTPLLLCLSCSECVFGRSCSNPSVQNVWHHGVFLFFNFYSIHAYGFEQSCSYGLILFFLNLLKKCAQ